MKSYPVTITLTFSVEASTEEVAQSRAEQVELAIVTGKFPDTLPRWWPDLESDFKGKRVKEGEDMVQQARAARPPAILPDVRDVVTSYETIVAELRDIIDTQSARESALKARVQNLADLLESEINRDTAALDEMRRTLEEIREVTA